MAVMLNSTITHPRCAPHITISTSASISTLSCNKSECFFFHLYVLMGLRCVFCAYLLYLFTTGFSISEPSWLHLFHLWHISKQPPPYYLCLYLYASGRGRNCILGWSSVKLHFFFLLSFSQLRGSGLDDDSLREGLREGQLSSGWWLLLNQVTN